MMMIMHVGYVLHTQSTQPVESIANRIKAANDSDIKMYGEKKSREINEFHM
jgi:hypothetical protein